ncbi:serine/threonine-protein kinase chk2 (cds1) [Penicillium cf. griseofulvum]|nr:serine/threonine-protein kinase chk2 (cds1) [Penicillium cf. griseofulvum]
MSDPLSITASIITVLQLAATATDYLRSIKNGAEDRVKLRDELRNTTYLLEMLRDRIEDAEDVVATLGTEKPMSIKSLSGPDNALVIFQRVVEDIIAQLSPQHLGQKLDDTHLRHQEDQNERIFLWFATLSFHEQHVAILESVQAGTGAWFIKHETLQNWLEGKISMIWCPGIPGAGKTRLMSIVINTLEHEKTSNNTLHTYIYCNYGRRKEQTYTALLSSLLLQVLQFSTSETVPPEVLSLYNSHKKYGTRPTSKELIDLLAKLTSPYETLFVVMDALD